MVAPSFESYKVISEEPFLKNGKLYLIVEHPKTHNQRTVRYYSDAEYAKAYGKKEIDTGFRNLKEVRGFKEGPITIIRNNKADDEEYLRRSVARFAVGIGWYIISSEKIPIDAPPHFKYLSLTWEEASIDENHLKDPNDIGLLLQRKAKDKQWIN